VVTSGNISTGYKHIFGTCKYNGDWTPHANMRGSPRNGLSHYQRMEPFLISERNNLEKTVFTL